MWNFPFYYTGTSCPDNEGNFSLPWLFLLISSGPFQTLQKMQASVNIKKWVPFLPEKISPTLPMGQPATICEFCLRKPTFYPQPHQIPGFWRDRGFLTPL